MPLAQQRQKRCDHYKSVLHRKVSSQHLLTPRPVTWWQDSCPKIQTFGKGHAWHLPLVSDLTAACSAVLVRTCCSTLFRADGRQLKHEQHCSATDIMGYLTSLSTSKASVSGCSAPCRPTSKSPDSNIRACTLSSLSRSN